MTTASNGDLAAQVGTNLPYLRRYARALTGAQNSGDKYAMATLEAILADPQVYDRSISPKAALFQVFHSIWSTSGATFEDGDTGLAARAQAHLSSLTNDTREALLLHTIEEFTFEDLGAILGVSQDEARELVDIAYSEMSKSVSGRVMIIEDEAIIAIDLEAIVSEMGHQITGVARTEEAAIKLAEAEKPDLILSDIHLADNSSGIDAVNRILAKHGDCPVIFITAYPERLLTGEGPEPAFLISKPYSEDQVRSAVSQAMFFASTETLKA
ncbi:response regulator [Marinibacterium profundimaris]|uniref:Two-component response regulator n=1 Tax=Marinibacterium profundimaris TaxID=1679460 RepID=A0A225NMN3_9RHOB|nr:response regulator [Marinibacterium profundimaris]OWU75715.1 two-component response regulator [Marinibacterium profundimaris]